MDRPPSGMLGEGAPPAAAVASGGGARADNGPPPNLGGARYDAATGVTHHSHLPITPMATSSIEAGGGRGGVLNYPSTMTVGGMDYGLDPKREYKVVQREQVANPAPLGLFAFGYTTALLQGANTAIAEASTSQMAACFGMFYGGLAQFLAGMWEFKRQNTFGAAAFTSYGAFWMSYALLRILAAAQLFKIEHNADQMMLALWGILTFIFMIATFELNACLTLLFFSLAVLFWLLCAGVEALTWTRIGGWWGLFVAGVAWYIAAADVINEQYKRTVLPICKWSVGVPMARGLKRVMAKIPVIGWAYVKACNREDKAAGYPSPKPKTAGEPAGLEQISEEPLGRPYTLHTTYSNVPGAAWEGQAVRTEQRYALQGSAVGPY